MILDVNSPLSGGYLDRTDPANTYNPTYYNQVFGVIEAFKNYPNTLGFFAGNEVINEQSVRSVPSYIRVCTLVKPIRSGLRMRHFIHTDWFHLRPSNAT